MATMPHTVPPDNLPMRTHLIEQCVPQLSLADLEAVGNAIVRRWQKLKTVERHVALEAHYAHLRALPPGTPLQVVVPHAAGFAAGDSVTIERPLRRPSTKIRVHDRHGKPWDFPMEWLISETEEASIRTVLRSEHEARGRAALHGLLERYMGIKPSCIKFMHTRQKGVTDGPDRLCAGLHG
jgi:hypothetical protein